MIRDIRPASCNNMGEKGPWPDVEKFSAFEVFLRVEVFFSVKFEAKHSGFKDRQPIPLVPMSCAFLPSQHQHL